MARNPRDDHRFDPWKRAASASLREIVDRACADSDAARRAIAEEEGQSPRNLQKRYEETLRATVEAVLLDAVAHHLEGKDQRIVQSMNESALGRNDANKAPAINSTLPKRIRELERTGWVDVDWGGRSMRRGKHETTFVAGPKLAPLLDERGITLRDIQREFPRDLLILRDANKQRISINSTPKTEALLRQMYEINELLAGAVIEPTAHFDGSVDLQDRVLRRTFMNGRLDHGGRLSGGFWVNMGKLDRLQQLQLDREHPVELDYSGCVTRIAYGLVGKTPPKPDVYDIPGLEDVERDGRKTLINALYWDRKRRDRLPQGSKKHFGKINGREADRLVRREHSAIEAYFGRSAGPHLQYYESKIILEVTLRLLRDGIVTLPIHDAVLVPASQAEDAHSVMEDAFTEISGGEPKVTLLDLEGD